MHLAALAANHDTWVVGWRTDHAQHFARGRLDGYDTAYFSFKQTLTQSLQIDVDAEREVFACNGFAVEGAVPVFVFNAPVGVAQQNLHTLLAPELFLVRTLYAKLADIVARLIVVVFLNIGRRHLSHVAQHMGCVGIYVLADAAMLDIESRETVHLFPEDAELLFRQLTHEELLGESRIAGVLVPVLDVVHALVELFLRNAEGVAEFQGVEMSAFLVHHHHQVVTVLVIDHQFSVAVGNDATGGELDFLEESVRVGVLLVVVAHNLERKQPDDVNHHNGNSHTAYDVSPVLQFIVSLHDLRKFSTTNISTTVSSVLPPMLSSHCSQLKKVKASSEKKTRL